MRGRGRERRRGRGGVRGRGRGTGRKQHSPRPSGKLLYFMLIMKKKKLYGVGFIIAVTQHNGADITEAESPLQASSPSPSQVVIEMKLNSLM